MNRVNIHWLVHGFALLHGLAVALCAWAGLPDTLLLTMLTMALAVLICYREYMTVDVTIISLVLVNSLGFVLGNLGAHIVFSWLPDVWQHIMATVIVTELLGWSLYLFAHRFSPATAPAYERKQSWKRNRWWLAAAILVVLGLRTYIGITFHGDLFFESGAVGISVLVTVVSLALMIRYGVRMQQEATSQRARRHQAEFRYMNLKRQVDPHFLFNSLNILDSIIQDGTKEEASQYIQKMASIYRYMMQHEAQHLVPVSDELAFARNYRDLMHIRFPEGLVTRDLLGTDVPSGYIIPCTLQLLLENAIKHNAISPDNPLVVTLSREGNQLTVRNNRIPKLSPSSSTGIGLQYIRNQYRDIANAEITITQTPEYFTVTIPVLQENTEV